MPTARIILQTRRYRTTVASCFVAACCCGLWASRVALREEKKRKVRVKIFHNLRDFAHHAKTRLRATVRGAYIGAAGYVCATRENNNTGLCLVLRVAKSLELSTMKLVGQKRQQLANCAKTCITCGQTTFENTTFLSHQLCIFPRLSHWCR